MVNTQIKKHYLSSFATSNGDFQFFFDIVVEYLLINESRLSGPLPLCTISDQNRKKCSEP